MLLFDCLMDEDSFYVSMDPGQVVREVCLCLLYTSCALGMRFDSVCSVLLVVL